MFLVLSFAGCIEQRDPPEEGKFTIHVESDPLLFANAAEAVLHAPHAEVDTELHHEHPDYVWTVGGVGEYEGEEADIGLTPSAIREVTLRLEYYEQERNVSLLAACIGENTEPWAVLVAGAAFEEGVDTPDDSELEFEAVAGLEELGRTQEYIGPMAEGEMYLGEDFGTSGLVVNVSLPWEVENATTYVFGFHWAATPTFNRWSEAVAINPGELHQLHYSGPGDLELTIANVSDPSHVHFEGAFEELPKAYQTHVGTLEWEGDVGPEEEAPGMASWTALLALSLIVVLMGRRRRRRA
jgi:hypothetical protein